MHVLQLLPALTVGGVERGVLDLAAGLVRRGHRVSVISSGGSLVEPLTACGAMHYRLPVHEKSLRAMAACVPAVTQIIRAAGIDLVHARSRVPGWIGFAAARRAERPFITTAHGFYAPHPASRVMVWGRVVIAPSEALGRYLVERLGLPQERLRVIPRGVDLTAFALTLPREPHDGPWRIGCFGRLSPIKGQAVALRAAAELIRGGHRIRLCLAGDVPGTPERRALEALADSLRITPHVEWLGVRHDMPQLIASVDLVAVPSTYPESFGRGALEALAVGRPVVASRIGALAEIVEDGATGLLVEPGHPAALAKGLERLIASEPLRRACVSAGRHAAETRWSAERMVERTLEVYDACLTRPRVLIWKLSALGDVILSTPSLRAIRRHFPKSRVTLVVGRSAYEAVARCPYLDDLIIFDPARKDRGPFRQAAFVRRLRADAFDVSIDLQNSRTTHWLAWRSGIPVRIGYRRRLRWLLNRGVRLPKVMLAPVAHQHYLLRQAGLLTDGDALELWPVAADEAQADRLLAAAPRGLRLVGVHPGGSGRWQTKRWDLERWAQLCDALAAQQVQVVVTGGPEERPLGEALRRMTRTAPLILIGQTSLMELACVIKRCRVFLAHDSSSLHVAAAVGTPTVALFGPTDPRRHLPPSFTGQVIKKDVFCSPCYSPRCRTVTHACMQRISVDEVQAAVQGWLAGQARPGDDDGRAGESVPR